MTHTTTAADQPRIIRWEITNTRTGNVTVYKTSAAASRAQDRMDQAYGAVCTTRRAIWSDQ